MAPSTHLTLESAPLLDGGQAHWRDEPTAEPTCGACQGWGSVNRRRPRPYVKPRMDVERSYLRGGGGPVVQSDRASNPLLPRGTSLAVPFLLGAVVTLAAVAWAKELLRP